MDQITSQKIHAVLKKANLNPSKRHTTRVKGFYNYTSGYEIYQRRHLNENYRYDRPSWASEYIYEGIYDISCREVTDADGYLEKIKSALDAGGIQYRTHERQSDRIVVGNAPDLNLAGCKRKDDSATGA